MSCNQQVDNLLDKYHPGVLLDHSLRTPEELDADIIRFAIEEGWNAHEDHVRAVELYEEGEEWWEPDVLSIRECLTYGAEDAMDWLNERVPDGYWVGNNGYAGAFGIWTMEEAVDNLFDV